MKFMELKELRLVQGEETETLLHIAAQEFPKVLGTSAQAKPEAVASMLKRILGLCH